jgi:hypothetical protein
MILKILAFIYLVIYIIHWYIKIPYFFVLYIFLSISLLILHLKEVNNFKRQLEIYKFEFYIREYESNMFMKHLQTFLILLLFILVVQYLPFEKREFADIDFVYVLFTLILTTYVNRKNDKYEFYYFGEEFIKKPGKTFSKIGWKDVKSVYEDEKDELIIMELQDGNNIKIGTEPYYSFFKKKNEILTYIQNKI